jgi:hypothetical protein
VAHHRQCCTSSAAKAQSSDEHLEQLRDDRPAELEVHVADRMSGLMGEPAAVADVEAAGEADRWPSTTMILRWLRRLA